MKSRWIWLLVAGLITAISGLLIGQLKSKDYLAQLYQRNDFTLLDDSGDFFQLSKFPDKKFLLLVFTPDGIHPDFVKPFFEFSKQAKNLLGVEVMLISRTNRDIVRNFRDGSAFKGRLLLDTSGSVGRVTGIWPSMEAVSHWGYVLTDRDFQLYWTTTASRVLSYQEVRDRVEKLRPSPQTSSGSR
jgi:peroxiredoxin